MGTGSPETTWRATATACRHPPAPCRGCIGSGCRSPNVRPAPRLRSRAPGEALRPCSWAPATSYSAPRASPSPPSSTDTSCCAHDDSSLAEARRTISGRCTTSQNTSWSPRIRHRPAVTSIGVRSSAPLVSQAIERFARARRPTGGESRGGGDPEQPSRDAHRAPTWRGLACSRRPCGGRRALAVGALRGHPGPRRARSSARSTFPERRIGEAPRNERTSGSACARWRSRNRR
jgi:hypothetical protein